MQKATKVGHTRDSDTTRLDAIGDSGLVTSTFKKRLFQNYKLCKVKDYLKFECRIFHAFMMTMIWML